MTIYARPRQDQNIRKPQPASLPDGISSKDLSRMAKKVEKILGNDHRLSKGEEALLRQIQLLCRRVIAFEKKDFAAKDNLDAEISKHRDLLGRLRFKGTKDIIPLNVWVTRQVVLEERGIDNLLKKVEERLNK